MGIIIIQIYTLKRHMRDNTVTLIKKSFTCSSSDTSIYFLLSNQSIVFISDHKINGVFFVNVHMIQQVIQWITTSSYKCVIVICLYISKINLQIDCYYL